MTYPRGGIYEGEYQNSDRHGQGTYTWKEGWKYDERHGLGTLFCSESSIKFQGEWSEGERVETDDPMAAAIKALGSLG